MKKAISIIMALVLAFAAIACSRSETWPESELASHLPKPDKGKNDSVYEFSDSLSITVKGIDSVDYELYVKKCIEAGFTEEASKSSTSYEAFNSDGYSLDLDLYNSSKELHIRLKEPIKLSSLRWPAGEAGKLIPKPTSSIGKTQWEYDRKFYLYVGDTDIDQFQQYIDSCIDAGFSIDYSRGDTFFTARNSLGYKLSLHYVGFHVMSVNIDEPEAAETEPPAKETEAGNTEPPKEEAPAPAKDVPSPAPTAVPTAVPTEAPTKVPSSNSQSSDLIRDDVKKAIDSYEAFVDEYCAFMKTYDASNLSSMNAYLALVQKELEMLKEFEAIKEKDLTTAETLYYAEVELRCSKKMLDAVNSRNN